MYLHCPLTGSLTGPRKVVLATGRQLQPQQTLPLRNLATLQPAKQQPGFSGRQTSGDLRDGSWRVVVFFVLPSELGLGKEASPPLSLTRNASKCAKYARLLWSLSFYWHHLLALAFYTAPPLKDLFLLLWGEKQLRVKIQSGLRCKIIVHLTGQEPHATRWSDFICSVNVSATRNSPSLRLCRQF